jgi:hypothetical protein
MRACIVSVILTKEVGICRKISRNYNFVWCCQAVIPPIILGGNSEIFGILWEEWRKEGQNLDYSKGQYHKSSHARRPPLWSDRCANKAHKRAGGKLRRQHLSKFQQQGEAIAGML